MCACAAHLGRKLTLYVGPQSKCSNGHHFQKWMFELLFRMVPLIACGLGQARSEGAGSSMILRRVTRQRGGGGGGGVARLLVWRV